MNKVFLTGLLAALLLAVTPVLQSGKISWYSVCFAAAVAGLSYLQRNLPGRINSIVGILAGAATNFFTAHPEPTGITLTYVFVSWVLPLVTQAVLAYSTIGEKTEPK